MTGRKNSDKDDWAELGQARDRIDQLEIAIANAIVYLGDAANVISPTGFSAAVIKSVDLLLIELFNEGGGHSELVGEKIDMAFSAALNLQNVLKNRPTKQENQTIHARNHEIVKVLKTALGGAATASFQAAQATNDALLAVQRAAATVRAAILKGVIDVAETALESAKAAAEAAKASAVSAMEAKKVAVSLTTHLADYELSPLATQASVASALAATKSFTALNVFAEANEAFNKFRKTA